LHAIAQPWVLRQVEGEMKVLNAAAGAAICLLGLAGAPALAQDAAAPAANTFGLELNKAETKDGACQMTFVVNNRTGTALDKSSYEMAIVDQQGQIATLINFSFEKLPADRRKVYQFSLKDLPCENIAAISVNRVIDCVATGGAASTVCEDMLEESSIAPSIQFPW
jgi:hypothetical protein